MKHVTRTLPVAAILIIGLAVAGCEDDNSPIRSVTSNPAGRLYVANQSDNTIYEFDTQTMARIDSFPSVVKEPHFLEISPDGTRLYAVGRNSPGQLARFDITNDNAFVDSLIAPDDLFPTAMMISPDGLTGYVCDFTSPSVPGKLHRYDLPSMSLRDTLLSVGSATHDLRITSDGKTVVAGNFGSDNITLVYPEGDSTFVVNVDPGNPVPIGSPRCGPYGIAIDNNDSVAFVACRLTNEIRVLDLGSRSIVDSIPIPIQSSESNAGPTLMTVSPDNDLLYITTQLENTVAVLRLSTRRVIAQIETGVMRPFGIDRSDNGSRYYVACVNSTNPLADRTGRIYVIDGATNSFVDSVDVGANSFGIVWTTP